MKRDNLCKVISNEELQAGYYRITLEKPFKSFQPGQFCMLKVPGMKETLLRRPFSLCQEDAQRFEIVYKAIGPVTHAMATLHAGQTVQALGPLGKGIDWAGYGSVIGIAGGYGIAPMLGLGRHLKAAGIEYSVYYGARSERDLLLQDDFAAADIELHISTEDGSRGFKGLVTELIADQGRARLASTDTKKTLWFVCGPHGLLQAVATMADDGGIDCHVSMEEYMGCGIGVCLGCVVKTRDGHYRRSCVEGPVMDAKSVSW